MYNSHIDDFCKPPNWCQPIPNPPDAPCAPWYCPLHGVFPTSPSAAVPTATAFGGNGLRGRCAEKQQRHAMQTRGTGRRDPWQ